MTKYILIFLLLTAVTYAQSGKSVLSPAQKDSIGAMISDSLENLTVSALPDSVIYTSELTPYVDKSSTQTIPGEKIFSNTKTVFSGDSVGIRGNLDVDGSFTFKGDLLGEGGFYFKGASGDVNGDDFIDILDFILIENYLNGIGNLTTAERMKADVNGDGTVDLQDTYVISQLNFHSLSDPGFEEAKLSAVRVVDSLRYRGVWNNFTIGSDGTLTINDYTFPVNDGTAGQFQRTDGNGQLYWEDYSNGGSVGNADSLGNIPASAYSIEKDSLLKVSGDTYKLNYSGSTINGWFGGLNDWTTNLSSGSATLFIGQFAYNTKRINSGRGAGTSLDYWNIDYVVPPYNLSANWLYSIEHRTDYYNDTLNTVAHSDIINIDGTGTPIWRTNDVRIMGNEIQVNLGDLPDSSALDWTYAGLTGNKVILSESGKTPLASLFPMPVKGFEFKFGSTPYYVYPKVYSFYSDLTTNSPDLDSAYHFYGRGNYPSYFGGNILTDGYIKVQDSIIIGSSTVKIYPDSITIGGTRVAKITEAGALDTTIVNNLIEANEDSSGSEIIGTAATLDSIITDYWNDALGGSTIDTTIVNNLIEANEDTSSVTSNYTLAQIELALNNLQGGTANQVLTKTDGDSLDYSWQDPTGSTFDTTFVYQRIANLESDVDSLMNLVAAILTALDTCGCGDIVVTDNTPNIPPISYVAVGGTSETQYVSTWVDPEEADLDSIRFYEGSSNDSTALNWIASIDETVETYTRTGRTANTTYWSAVKAVDDSGNVSYFSNIDSAKTLASAVSDTGFYKFDAEDGLANLVLSNAAYVTDTSGFSYAGTHSYKIRGNGTTNGIFADIYPFPAGYGNEATIWVSYRVYIPSGSTTNQTSNDYQYLTLFGDAADVNGDDGWLGVSTDGSANIDNWVKPWGTELSTNFSLDTWHKIEIKYVQGTGANAQDSIWVDGTPVYGVTNGASTVTTSRFRFGYYGSWRLLSGEAIYFDDIILKRTRVQ